MRNKLVFAGALERGEREQPGVIAETARGLRFAHGLRRAPREPRDHDRLRARPLGRAAHRELQHRPVEPDVADRELGGVDADREPAGAGVEVVAGERALAASVEPAIGIERQRMRRDHRALAQRGEYLRRPVLPAQRHCFPASVTISQVTIWLLCAEVDGSVNENALEPPSDRELTGQGARSYRRR